MRDKVQKKTGDSMYVKSKVAIGLTLATLLDIGAANATITPIPASKGDTYRVISADGIFIGGYTTNNTAGGRRQAVLWAFDSPRVEQRWLLSPLDESGASEVTAITRNANYIAGKSTDANGKRHAVIWDGVNGRPVDLDSGTPVNSNGSTVTVISEGQHIAGGYMNLQYQWKNYDRATLWTDTGRWEERVTLGTLRDGDVGHARVHALSENATVVGGQAEIETGKQRAIIWHGDKWEQKVKLGTLRDDNPGSSQVNALSADGRIAAGEEKTRAPYKEHALVWHGEQWKEETRLGTLLPDNSGSSTVHALSADGKVAAGRATADTRIDPETGLAYHHGVIWAGDNWATKTDLGTLRSDNSGNSSVLGLSADGQIAVGSADTEGGRHSVVWTLLSQSDVPTSLMSVTNKARAPYMVRKVDATNTLATLARLGRETFTVMEMQRQALTRLQQGCAAENGESCWSVRTDFTAIRGNRDTAAGFSLAQGVGDRLSVGIHLDHSVMRSLPGSYRNAGSNLGAGLFAQWRQPLVDREWYLRPSFAFNQYDVDMRRPLLANTEAGNGRSKMKGWAASLEGGQAIFLANTLEAGWHIGVRHSHVKRAGYTEQGVDFPVMYSDVDYRTTSAYAGADISVPMTGKLSWVSGAEIERMLKNNASTFSAGAAYIGSVAQEADKVRMQGNIKSGVRYTLSSDVVLSLMPEVSKTALGDTTWGGSVGLSGRF